MEVNAVPHTRRVLLVVFPLQQLCMKAKRACKEGAAAAMHNGMSCMLAAALPGLPAAKSWAHAVRRALLLLLSKAVVRC